MNIFQNIKYELQKQNYLTILIAVNLALFLTINIGLHMAHVSGLESYLAMPLNPSVLATRFWTPVTYMFSHERFGHLFYNMLLLYFSGRLFTTFFKEQKLLYVYIMSGLSAAVFLLILSFIFPSAFEFSSLLGASAAVLGVICCIAIYSPDLPINLFGFFEIRYKYFALFIFLTFTILDFTINSGGKISHIAGAAFGLLYGYSLRQGRDFSGFSFFRKNSPLKVVHKRGIPDEEYNMRAADNQKTVDALLDKISKNGYDSLSKAEKELLFKLSQKK
jgi:rhomboid family protein